jgi:hypothetical protein
VFPGTGSGTNFLNLGFRPERSWNPTKNVEFLRVPEPVPVLVRLEPSQILGLLGTGSGTLFSNLKFQRSGFGTNFKT